MCMWIKIITKNLGRRADKRMLSEPDSISPTSPCGMHLYSSPQHSSESSYSYLPSSPSLSRPDSQLSDYSVFAPRSQAPMTKPGYTTSCPTTPLSYRRYSPTIQLSPPPPSPYRSNHIKKQSPSSNKVGVFQTLYRPDLLKLSSLRQGRKCNVSKKKSLSHSSVDSSGENSLDTDYKTDSATLNDDYSVHCDELLEEFEADFIYGNGSQNKVKSNIDNGTKQNRKELVQNIACMNHKQVIHLNKVKTVELLNIDNVKDIPDNRDESDESDYESRHSDQPDKTQEDYFNNLLAIIEEAAHSLKTL
jgi:hypothetical protein